jgi:hypothetical protein
MARRSPGSVRARGRRRFYEPGIPGLSARGNACLRELERTRLWPGAAEDALMAWEQFVHDPMHRLWDPDSGCGQLLCCPDPAELRWRLALIAHCLPPADARLFRARVAAADELW